MYVPFAELSDDARVWVYAANRPFNEAERHPLLQGLTTFVDSWTAHNKTLKASYELLENQFIVLAVDEAQHQASGCSIDKSVHFLQVIESEFGIELFNRTLIYYYEGPELRTANRSQFDQRMQNGVVHADSVVINTLVFTKKELNEKFRLPLRESWHAKVFGLAAV